MTSLARYKLSRIHIQGFKGFTTRQTIEIGGKPTFIFGENGYGKSSIVEAVIWCLFGAEHRPGSVVRNVLYPQPCIVEIELQTSDGVSRLRRTLQPGAHESTIAAFDPAGRQVTTQELFPDITRIAHGEGATIALSQQQDRERRIADVSDFGMTLCTYLGIDLVPRAAESLAHAGDSSLVQHDDLAERLQEVTERIDQRLELLESQITDIQLDPPWKSGSLPPTRAATHQSIGRVYRQACKLSNEPTQHDLAVPDQVRETQRLLSATHHKAIQESAEQLDEVRAEHDALVATRARLQDLEREQFDVQSELQDSTTHLTHLTGAQIPEDPRLKLLEIEERVEEEGAEIELRRSAASHMERWGSTLCPVCGTAASLENLRTTLTTTGEATSSDSPEPATTDLQAENPIAIRDALQRYIRAIDGNTTIVERRAAIISNLEVTIEDGASVSIELLDSLIKDHGESVEQLESTLVAQQEPTALDRRIQALTRQIRYHQLRLQRDRLQSIKDESVKQAEDRITSVRSQIDNMGKIRETLLEGFNEALDQALPAVERRMTEVYLQMTLQKSFDKVRVERGDMTPRGPRLMLRVASPLDPDRWHDPEQVLNGKPKALFDSFPISSSPLWTYPDIS